MKTFWRAAWQRFLHDETGAICVGCGLAVDPITGFLSVEQRPNGGILCDNSGDADDGIYLDARTLSTSTVTVGGTGTLASPLTAAVKISAADCNALVVDGTGLYVACQDGVAATSAVQTSPQGSGLPQAVVNGGTYNYGNDNAFNSIHICNPTCCTISGVVFVAVGNVYLEGPAGFIGGAHLQANINNTGYADINPSTRQTLSADSGNAQNMYLDINQNASLFVSLAPAECVDYQFNLQFNINTAAGGHIRTDSTGPQFVTRWVLTHTGCCDHAG